MKTLFTFLLLSITSLAVYSQNGNGNNNSNNNNNGRENWFPSHGRVGVGTRTPSADLEVIGNIIATNRVSAQDINSNNFQGASLLLSNNAIVNGRIGIGINNPTEALDVIGNFRLQGNFSAQSLTSQNAQFSALTVSGNSAFNGSSTFSQSASFANNVLVSGKVGIGVQSPGESLDVLGNFRLQGNISGQQATFSSLTTSGAGSFNSLQVVGQSLFGGTVSFSENTSLSKNLFVSGKIGIGVNSPTESLEVSGNLKSTGIISGNASLTTLQVSGNTVVNGALGIGTASPEQKLHVAGSVKVNDVITATDVQATNLITQHFETTDGKFTDHSTFEKNVIVNEKLAIGLSSPTESLDVNGNGKFSGNVSASQVNASTANFSNGVQAGNSTINGSLAVSGPFTAQSISLADIDATNNVAIANDLNVGGATALTGNLGVQGASTLSSLTVSGETQLQSVNAAALAVTQNASVGQNLTVQGNLQVVGAFSAGSMSVTEVNSQGSMSTSQNLSVTGTSQFTGQANFGTIHAGVIEATEFRTPGGNSPFNLDNAVIQQTLAIATANNTVPSNYKLAVGGNIIATGIDIKIPQKWPDYVFTDGHKLQTIEEVDAYIKQHGHLPGVLSAEQMKQKENYSVSYMDAKLLEKIEELTLYIIELKKEIESLKNK